MTIQDIINRGNIIKNIEGIDRVTEIAFVDFANNEAVEKLVIIQTKEGKFILVAKLTWKDALCVIETARGDIKEWADSQRLAKHMVEKFPPIPQIEVIMNNDFNKSLFGNLTNIKSVHFDTDLNH